MIASISWPQSAPNFFRNRIWPYLYLYYNRMGPPSYMRSVVERNVGLRQMTVRPTIPANLLVKTYPSRWPSLSDVPVTLSSSNSVFNSKWVIFWDFAITAFSEQHGEERQLATVRHECFVRSYCLCLHSISTFYRDTMLLRHCGRDLPIGMAASPILRASSKFKSLSFPVSKLSGCW